MQNSNRNMHDAEWWIGQVMSLLIAICLLREYNGAIAAAACYAIAVLVDIRESVSRRR